jgi:cytidine deaminase
MAVNESESLLTAARQAAQQAHCPYSHFHVGAAVACADGSVVSGCNVENASYGLSLCAERVALFAAVSQGKRPIRLAVSCIDAQDDAAQASKMPCGACRQVMQELMPPGATIHIDGVGPRTIEELLPESFQLKPDAHQSDRAKI